jgi:hypothetical protein
MPSEATPTAGQGESLLERLLLMGGNLRIFCARKAQK